MILTRNLKEKDNENAESTMVDPDDHGVKPSGSIGGWQNAK